jgi:hypothetical protein
MECANVVFCNKMAKSSDKGASVAVKGKTAAKTTRNETSRFLRKGKFIETQAQIVQVASVGHVHVKQIRRGVHWDRHNSAVGSIVVVVGDSQVVGWLVTVANVNVFGIGGRHKGRNQGSENRHGDGIDKL